MKRELLDNGNIWQKSDGRWIGMVRYKDEFGVAQRKSFSSKIKKTLQAKMTEYVKNFQEQIAQGVGGQKATFPFACYAGDDVALLASTRQCTRNGVKETKDGFYQYSAAWDSKHIVSIPQGKSAQLLYSMQEMDDGGELL